jgi:hypothetical protein
MSDQDLFFDEDEATGQVSAPAAPAAPAPSPGLHSVSPTVALLMTLAGLLAGVIVGLLIPAA